MSAGRYSFNFENGADFDVTLVDERVATYTGFTGLMEVRSKAGGTLYITLSTANGRMVTGNNGTYGTVVLHIDAADTALLSWTGRAYYDILLTDVGTERFLEGRVTLSPAISVP